MRKETLSYSTNVKDRRVLYFLVVTIYGIIETLIRLAILIIIIIVNILPLIMVGMLGLKELEVVLRESPGNVGMTRSMVVLLLLLLAVLVIYIYMSNSRKGNDKGKGEDEEIWAWELWKYWEFRELWELWEMRLINKLLLGEIIIIYLSSWGMIARI